MKKIEEEIAHSLEFDHKGTLNESCFFLLFIDRSLWICKTLLRGQNCLCIDSSPVSINLDLFKEVSRDIQTVTLILYTHTHTHTHTNTERQV